MVEDIVVVLAVGVGVSGGGGGGGWFGGGRRRQGGRSGRGERTRVKGEGRGGVSLPCFCVATCWLARRALRTSKSKTGINRTGGKQRKRHEGLPSLGT